MVSHHKALYPVPNVIIPTLGVMAWQQAFAFPAIGLLKMDVIIFQGYGYIFCCLHVQLIESRRILGVNKDVV